MNLYNCLVTTMCSHMTNTNLKMWTPNHFVPCVRSICKTTGAQKNTTIEPGSKRSASDFFSNCKKNCSWEPSNQEEEKSRRQEKKGERAKTVRGKNMALWLTLFYHNSLVQNIIIYLVDMWHYAIYWIILHKTVAYVSYTYGKYMHNRYKGYRYL